MSKKKKPKVDSFYTQKMFGQQFALVPLMKPIKLSYDTDINTWGFLETSYKGFSFIGANAKKIGVQGQYVYGKVEEREYENEDLLPDEIVYALSSGGATWSTTEKKGSRYKKATSMEGKTNSYLLSERWFILSTNDEKSEGFFDKNEYIKSLKEKGIDGKMYNSDSLLSQFQETGVLEYFPDSIKAKLRP
ncbi:hypothetical protein N9Y48_03795 [Zobellia sp.]|nr:hypothetical protein [Zobellia sp.]